MATNGVNHRTCGARIAGKDLTAAFNVWARDVDFDRGYSLFVAQPVGEFGKFADRTPCDRHHGACPALAQPPQILTNEFLDARALQPNGIKHPGGSLRHSRSCAPRPWGSHDALGHNGADCRYVEEPVKFTASRRATRSREYRRGQGRAC